MVYSQNGTINTPSCNITKDMFWSLVDSFKPDFLMKFLVNRLVGVILAGQNVKIIFNFIKISFGEHCGDNSSSVSGFPKQLLLQKSNIFGRSSIPEKGVTICEKKFFTPKKCQGVSLWVFLGVPKKFWDWPMVKSSGIPWVQKCRSCLGEMPTSLRGTTWWTWGWPCTRTLHM